MSDPVYVHIHAPQPIERRLRRLHCPNCKRMSWFVSFFVEWYGWDSTCLRCGDRWEDGEMLERPFMPRWRHKSKDDAKRRWRNFKP